MTKSKEKKPDMVDTAIRMVGSFVIACGCVAGAGVIGTIFVLGLKALLGGM